MYNKIVLTSNQKEILIETFNLPFSLLKKKLELIASNNNDIFKWALTDGSKNLGSYLTDYAVEQIVALPESRISYEQIIDIAKVGDKIQGHFYLNYLDDRKELNEIIIDENILYRLNEGDIKEGARYYLKKIDGGFKYMVIVKK